MGFGKNEEAGTTTAEDGGLGIASRGDCDPATVGNLHHRETPTLHDLRVFVCEYKKLRNLFRL